MAQGSPQPWEIPHSTTTLACLPREVLKWVLSLDLSYTVRHVKRDFSNGFLFAETLSRYYPADIQMHSFENVISKDLKRANWLVLERFFKRRGIQVPRDMIEAVIAAQGNAAAELLLLLHNFINSDAYGASLSKEEQGRPGSPPRDRAHRIATGPAPTYNRGAQASSSGQYDGFSQEAIMQQMWQQAAMMQQAATNSRRASVNPADPMQAYMLQMAAYQQAMVAQASGMVGVPGGGGGQPPEGGGPGRSNVDKDLVFSRKPRHVQYTPYDLADFNARDFNIKHTDGYWKLGGLGANMENRELQEKRERTHRMKQVGSGFSKANMRAAPPLPRPAADVAARPAQAAAAARQLVSQGSAHRRAKEYARLSVPKAPPGRRPPATAPAGGRSSSLPRSHQLHHHHSQQYRQQPPRSRSPIATMAAQHDADTSRVEAIRRELEAMLAY